jgi:hypothetical protein
MILITAAAATTYGWIEGYMIRGNLADKTNYPLGHYLGISSYHVAFGIMFGLITGGFALIKSRNMFARGNRYFLFACIGNYPFSWLIEDFTYFLFNPLGTLTASMQADSFGLGGWYVYGPWISGSPKPEFFVPAWYFIAFTWFLGCQWFAHRCTVYDAMVKDELGQTFLPKSLPIPLPTPAPKHSRFSWLRFRGKTIPPVPPAPPVEEHGPTNTNSVPTRRPQKTQPTQTKKTSVIRPTVKEPVDRRDRSLQTPTPVRSADAEEALKRLRARWVKAN